jgi:FkbM family methyltransferase
LSQVGFEVRRSESTIGVMDQFLERLRKNGLMPRVILDVGANAGHWSQQARQVFPEARFVLVEPQIEMRPYLEAFCRTVPGSRWELAGAGREPGELVLTVWPELAGSTLLPVEHDKTREKRTVPIITIDSLFPEGAELPQLAKLDIQGFELEALSAANCLFGHTECFIVEVSLFSALPGMPVLADVVTFFDERGYKVYDVPGYLRRPLDNALGQVDLAFVLKDGILGRDQRWDARSE